MRRSEQALEPEEQSSLDRKLIAAAWENDLSEARRLIEEGADVNAKDDSVQSAYLISASEGYVELLELTLEHGADVTSLDSFNGTGLIRAADRGHVEIVRELLETDIDVDHVNNLGWTALLEAIILGDGGPRHTEVVGCSWMRAPMSISPTGGGPRRSRRRGTASTQRWSRS